MFMTWHVRQFPGCREEPRRRFALLGEVSSAIRSGGRHSGRRGRRMRVLGRCPRGEGGRFMKHDEMIGKVQALAQLPDRGSAERTMHAVLSTLSERLPSGLARHVAAQLPPDLAAA